MVFGGVFDAITDIGGDALDFITEDVFDFISNDLVNTDGDDGLFSPEFLEGIIGITPGLFGIGSQPDPGRITPQFEANQELAREKLAQEERLTQAGIDARLQAAEITAGAAVESAGIAAAASKENAIRGALSRANQLMFQSQDNILNQRLQAARGRPDLIQAATSRQVAAAGQSANVAQNVGNNLSAQLGSSARVRAQAGLQ